MSGHNEGGFIPASRSEFRRSLQSACGDVCGRHRIRDGKMHLVKRHGCIGDALTARQPDNPPSRARQHRRAVRGAIRGWRAVIRATRPAHRGHCPVRAGLHGLDACKDHGDPQDTEQNNLAQFQNHSDFMRTNNRLRKTRIADRKRITNFILHSRTAWPRRGQTSVRPASDPQPLSGRERSSRRGPWSSSRI